MDKYLQLLRRKAATGDIDAINLYVHKLEQAAGYAKVSETEEDKKAYVLWMYSVESEESSGPLAICLDEKELKEEVLDHLETVDFDLDAAISEDDKVKLLDDLVVEPDDELSARDIIEVFNNANATGMAPFLAVTTIYF